MLNRILFATLFISLSAVSIAETVAEVKPHHGVPTLFINEQAQTGLSYMSYTPSGEYFKGISDAGVNLYSFSATPTAATPYTHLIPTAWTGLDTFDFTTFDARVKMLLEANPRAMFFPRLFLGTPEWWAEAHPEELVRYDANDGSYPFMKIRDKKVASFASEIWRQDTRAALRRMITHIEAAPYADHVIGYQLASGVTEEWMQWYDDIRDHWADYSPVNEKRFQAWLKMEYSTDQALQNAWSSNTVSINTAKVPSYTLRAQSERGWLRDPKIARSAIDYARYNAWLVADTICYFAQDVKAQTGRKKVVGTFYGYIPQLASFHTEQTAGHGALEQVLDSKDIDFLTSPTSYTMRDLGSGFPHSMTALATVQRHGKLWFDENDHRTFLAKQVPENFPGWMQRYETTLLDQQREFGWIMAEGLAMWWFDMGGGWYQDERLLSEMGNMVNLAEEHRDADRSSVAEIAMVIDPKSGYYLRANPDNPIGWPSMQLQQETLARLGAPFDIILLSDLARAQPYKLYLFANTLAPSDEERSWVRDIVQQPGIAAIWVGPAGLYKNGHLAPAAMESLTGFPIALEDSNEAWEVHPTEAAGTWGWHSPEAFASRRGDGVLPIPHDIGTTLAVLKESGRPAVVAQETDGHISVFSSIPRLPISLLRSVAEKVNVHQYINTTDVVWASRDFLSIHAEKTGTRHITLPEKRKVIDVWTGQVLSSGTTRLSLHMGQWETEILRLMEPD